MRGALIVLVATLLSLAGESRAAPRIVSLDQCADQFVLALAPRDEIVALSKRALNADSNQRDRAVGLPKQRPTMEAILGDRPTIVVRYWTADARLPEALRRRGILVAQIDEAKDFPSVRSNIRKVAAMLGRQAAGEALIARMDSELASSQGAWGGARAIYLTPYGFTAGRDTLVGSMMAAAGLLAATNRPEYAPVSLESLVLRPPDALVLGFFRDLASGRQRWTIAGNRYLQGLVAQRTIASLPGSILGCPAWFAADGARALAEARPASRR